MKFTTLLTVVGLTAAGAASASAQPAPTTPSPRVEEIRVIRGGPGMAGEADVVVGAPDIAWAGLGVGPDAVHDDPVRGAPFTADAISESVQVLADGNRIVRETSASLARDGEGRTRREQTVGPRLATAGEAPSPRQLVTIADPVAGERYLLDAERRTARKLPRMFIRATASPGGMTIDDATARVDVRVRREPGDGILVPPPPPPPPPPADGRARVTREAEVIATPDTGVLQWTSDDVQTEDLGTRDVEGVQATGTRRTVTIAAGAIGNEQPIQIVSERWYAPELKTVVFTRRSDPRTGEHTYRLTNIVRGEPDPSLFQVPSDYTVEAMPAPRVMLDRRTP